MTVAVLLRFVVVEALTRTVTVIVAVALLARLPSVPAGVCATAPPAIRPAAMNKAMYRFFTLEPLRSRQLGEGTGTANPGHPFRVRHDGLIVSIETAFAWIGSGPEFYTSGAAAAPPAAARSAEWTAGA